MIVLYLYQMLIQRIVIKKYREPQQACEKICKVITEEYIVHTKQSFSGKAVITAFNRDQEIFDKFMTIQQQWMG